MSVEFKREQISFRTKVSMHFLDVTDKVIELIQRHKILDGCL